MVSGMDKFLLNYTVPLSRLIKHFNFPERNFFFRFLFFCQAGARRLFVLVLICLLISLERNARNLIYCINLLRFSFLFFFWLVDKIITSQTCEPIV